MTDDSFEVVVQCLSESSQEDKDRRSAIQGNCVPDPTMVRFRRKPYAHLLINGRSSKYSGQATSKTSESRLICLEAERVLARRGRGKVLFPGQFTPYETIAFPRGHEEVSREIVGTERALKGA